MDFLYFVASILVYKDQMMEIFIAMSYLYLLFLLTSSDEFLNNFEVLIELLFYFLILILIGHSKNLNLIMNQNSVYDHLMAKNFNLLQFY